MTDRSKLDGPLFPLQYGVYRTTDGKRLGGADTLAGARWLVDRRGGALEIRDEDAGVVLERYKAVAS